METFERLRPSDQDCCGRRFEQIIGNSPALEVVLDQVERVAPTNSTVLIEGETGTGKELIARALHNISGRCGRRSDLFFRLNVFPLQIPPLRERPEDIPLLVRHFAEEFSRRMNRTIETISSETMKALCRYSWPGNVRELQNVIERAVILSSGPSLNVPVAELQHRTKKVAAGEDSSAGFPRRKPVRSILTEVDRNQIIEALKEAGGRIGGSTGAASRLGLKRTTFITRMKKLGINPNRGAEHDGAGANSSDTSMM